MSKVTPENQPLHDEIMQLIQDTCERVTASGLPMEISREVETKATAEIKRELEGKTLEEMKKMLAYSIYMNIAVALENADSENVGVNV